MYCCMNFFKMLTSCDNRPATVYAFDIIERFGGPFLANKRVFAYPLAGIPRGILCYTQYVFIACGDGVEVWKEDGNLLGVIEVPGKSYDSSLVHFFHFADQI